MTTYKLHKRTTDYAEYMLEHRTTLRATADRFGVSKSTVHRYLKDILPKVNLDLAQQVRELLKFNLQMRHIRGGEATRVNSLLRKQAKYRQQLNARISQSRQAETSITPNFIYDDEEINRIIDEAEAPDVANCEDAQDFEKSTHLRFVAFQSAISRFDNIYTTLRQTRAERIIQSVNELSRQAIDDLFTSSISITEHARFAAIINASSKSMITILCKRRRLNKRRRKLCIEHVESVQAFLTKAQKGE